MFDIETANLYPAQSPENFIITTDTCSDPITCVTVSDRFLLVARKSGFIVRYTLPHLTPENSYLVHCEPFRIDFNSSSSRVGMIDVNGIFTILDLEVRHLEARKGLEESDTKSQDDKSESERGGPLVGRQQPHISNKTSDAIGELFGKRLSFERKDVWDMRWAGNLTIDLHM